MLVSQTKYRLLYNADGGIMLKLTFDEKRTPILEFTDYIRLPQLVMKMQLFHEDALEDLLRHYGASKPGDNKGGGSGLEQTVNVNSPAPAGSSKPSPSPSPSTGPGQQPDTGHRRSSRLQAKGTGARQRRAEVLIYSFGRPGQPLRSKENWLELYPHRICATLDRNTALRADSLHPLPDIDHTPGSTLFPSQRANQGGVLRRDSGGKAGNSQHKFAPVVLPAKRKRKSGVSYMEVSLLEPLQGYNDFVLDPDNATMVWRGQALNQSVVVKIAQGLQPTTTLMNEYGTYLDMDAACADTDSLHKWSGRCLGLYHSRGQPWHLLVLRDLGPSLLALEARGETGVDLKGLFLDLESLHGMHKRHGDVSKRNVCFDGTRTYLIDFGFCATDFSEHIHEPDEDGLLQQLQNSMA